jgi:hypothetical protein
MSGKSLRYVSGEPWWRTLGLRDYRGHSWTKELEHIISETTRAMREHGLDPDVAFERLRTGELAMVAPCGPLISECCQAYMLAKACLLDPETSLRGFRLANVWSGQGLAAVAAPALLAQQRAASIQKRATKAAAAANKRRGEKTRERIAKTGKVGKLTDRHVRRLVSKKK